MKISFPNLALFQRSILLDNRHWQSYIYRFVVLFIILFTLFEFFMTSYTRMVNAPGLRFLTTIAHINLVFITFLAISMFATAITEEKEVDSLGLLLMTGISPLSMLVSKGTGKLVMGLLLVISQFPFVLLSITMGGVGLSQVVSVFITMLVYMILVNNLALFLSVVFRRNSTAGGMCLFVLFAFNALTPIWTSTRWLSPFYRVAKIMQTFSTEPMWSLQNTVYIFLSILFFVLSYLFFDICCRNTKPASAPRLSAKSRSSKWNIFRVKRVWKNAIAWKTFYFNAGGKYGLLIIPIVLLIIIAVVFAIYLKNIYYGSPDKEDIGVIFLVTGLIALFAEGIYISETLFHSEVWQQTLSTLLTIPQSLKSIAYKKILGGLIITIPTLMFVLVGLWLISDDLSNEIDEPEFWGAIIIFMLSVIFYYHLVTFFSLIMKYGGFIIAWLAYGVIYMVVLIPFGIFMTFTGPRWINEIVVMSIVIILYIPLIVVMHFLIGMKIKSIAAKG